MASADPTTGSFHAGSRRSLLIAFVLVTGYMLAEWAGGLLSHSLALLADAGHMLTDAAALGFSLVAMALATRPPSTRRTYGFQRAEVLAALLNAASLWVLAVWIFYEAYQRFTSPPEIVGPFILAVGALGLVVNLVTAWMLKGSAKESLNAEGAFLHVLGDLLGSVGVVAAGLLIIAFAWYLADPVLGVVIAVLILFSATRLLWKTLHVLMEGTPLHLDLGQLCSRLEQVEGVTGVHDIHVWSMTTGYDVLSAHVTAQAIEGEAAQNVLQHLRDIAAREYGIHHVTIQLEETAEVCQERHHTAHA